MPKCNKRATMISRRMHFPREMKKALYGHFFPPPLMPITIISSVSFCQQRRPQECCVAAERSRGKSLFRSRRLLLGSQSLPWKAIVQVCIYCIVHFLLTFLLNFNLQTPPLQPSARNNAIEAKTPNAHNARGPKMRSRVILASAETWVEVHVGVKART